MELERKLAILADAAKYDASCSSSGTEKRHSLGKAGGIGSTEGSGISHSSTASRATCRGRASRSTRSCS
jgi:predicted DNA-binding helix-hairpin-helix protein